jgi:LuxR family maltose regulon positive regulatory protein
VLIETKIRVPTAAASAFARPALLAAMRRAEQQRLTLIEAPAGFGKTTLLAQWAAEVAHRGIAVAWLSAEAADNRIDRFLAYLVGALQRAAPDVAAPLMALIETAPVAPVETLLATLVNTLAGRRGDIILVIDDFHHLDAPEIRAFVQTLLGHAPEPLHMVLATRERAPLQLAGLRARGHLLRLDDTALRFTLAETERLLNGMRHLGLTAAELALLQHRTEGWAAGVHLAGLSLEDRSDRQGFLHRFSGAEGAVAEFLAEAALARIEPELLDFLIRIAILERFTAPLAEALTGRGEAAALIARAEAANLFLGALDRDRTWFRYHGLFADLLRAELRRRWPEAVAGLHRAAARWLAEAGLTSEAVDHALAAGERTLAAELVESCCMGLIMSRNIALVRGWLGRLPGALIEARPRLMLAQVWVHFHTSQPAAGARLLGRARRAIARQRRDGLIPPALAGDLDAEIRVLSAGVLSAADHSRLAIRIGERCLPGLPRHLRFLRGVLHNVMAFSHYSLGDLGAARAHCLAAREHHAAAPSAFGQIYSELILGLADKAAGELDAALGHFARAARIARDSDGPGSYSEAMVGIFEAEIRYERDDHETAAALVAKHRPLIEECGLVVHDMTCKLLVARLAASAGHLDAALAELEAAERLGLRNRYRRLFAGALHERIKLLVRRGDVHLARLVLTARGIDEAWLTDPRAQRPASELEHVALARVLIAEGRPQTALRLLERLGAPMRRDGRMRRLILVRALAAIAAHRAGDALAAMAAIAEAIGLAAPQGAFRTLREEGEALGEVLAFGFERIPDWRKPETPARRLVERLLTGRDAAEPAPPHRPGRARAAAPPDFSPREYAVARLLGQGCGNREIASALGMAPDTVKWHLKNIFGKLGVGNRTQAVLRLQKIGVTATGVTATVTT